MSSQIIKAVILVGGYGTRLRPFTFTTPKPLIPFANEPILKHQIRALSNSGVKEIILAMNYKTNKIKKAVETFEKEFNIKIIFSIEDEVLNTGGPIGLVKERLKNCLFFVLNADVICNFPLKEMINFHKKHEKMCTILTTKTETPERFGVLKITDNLVTGFFEKPKVFKGNDINAGIYIFSSNSLDLFEAKNISIETEVFPKISEKFELMSFPLIGYWKDIGQPKDFLLAQKLFLEEKMKFNKNLMVKNNNLDSEKNVVVGENVEIGVNFHAKDSTIMQNTKIGNNVVIENSIIGPYCILEDNTVIKDLCLLGDGVKVKECSKLTRVIACPFKTINSSEENKIIL